MASILNIGGDKYLTVDRMWRDNGSDAQYGLVGGQKILIAQGNRPKPTICQRGAEFFYSNGTRVMKVEDVDWLPEPFRTTAISYVEKLIKKDKPEPVPTFSSKQEAAAAATPKRRGRPKKATAKPKTIEIKDEESLRNAGGVVI